MQIHSSSTPYRSLIGPGKAETGFSPEEEKPQETGEAESAQGDLQSPANLYEEQLRQVEKLKQRDREVHTHEMAHLAAAGPYAQGGPSFEYQKGPDGQRYAVGGHVNIDTSPVPGDPEATLRKAETVRRAAMAPGNPSPRTAASLLLPLPWPSRPGSKFNNHKANRLPQWNPLCIPALKAARREHLLQ